MGAAGRAGSLALLEAAYDAGVRHFDVAPLYGFGQAEGCVGEFLARHPGECTVATKYGIPPAKNPGLIGLARAVARPVLRVLPGVKQRLAGAAGKAFAGGERAKFTVEEARASIERSLRELRVGRIDLWLLHEVTADDLRFADELLRYLDDRVAAGVIGAFGVGSERTRVETLAMKRPQFCRVVQFEWSILDRPVSGIEGFRIQHRALTESFRRLHAWLVADRRRCAEWTRETGAELEDREVLAGLMLRAALNENAGGIVLFSSKNAAHMRRNVQVAEDSGLDAAAAALYRLAQTAARELREIEVGG
jgi:D-threo-aldose 1-dehydrogenase